MKNKKKTLLFRLLLSTAILGTVVAIPLVSVSCSSTKDDGDGNKTNPKPTITNIDVNNISESRFANLVNAKPFDQNSLSEYMKITGDIKTMNYDVDTNEISGTYIVNTKDNDIASIGITLIKQPDFFSTSEPTISNIDVHNITSQQFENLFVVNDIDTTVTNLQNYMNISNTSSIDSIIYDNDTNQIKGKYKENVDHKIYEFESAKMPDFGVLYGTPNVLNMGMKKITELNFEALANKAVDESSWLKNKDEIEKYLIVNHDEEIQALLYSSSKHTLKVTYLVNSWDHTAKKSITFDASAVIWKS